MTPAINLLKKAKKAYQIHQYQHDSSAQSYGEEAAEKLGLPLSRVFKTLVVSLDTGKMAVCILPVSGRLRMKSAASALACRKIEMANPERVSKTTGYVMGGISPLGQRTQLKTIIDSSALKFETIFVSAGRRGLEIEVSANILAEMLSAKFAEILQEN